MTVCISSFLDAGNVIVKTLNNRIYLVLPVFLSTLAYFHFVILLLALFLQIYYYYFKIKLLLLL